jgi:hypothetical protein
MEQLCRITVPGLSVKRDFAASRERLLADFPNIHEVLATTAPETLMVLYSGPENVRAWLDSLLESVPAPEVKRSVRLLSRRIGRLRGDDSAA